MPRRKMTDAEKALISQRMKTRWKRARQEPSTNGTRVEQRIVLHLKGTSHDLTLTEAVALQQALTMAITAPKTDPAHD